MLMTNKKIKVGITNKEGQLGFVFSRGGLREGAGRKKLGVTKKISLTLTEDMWKRLEIHCSDNEQTRSEVIRNIIESYYSK